jgi:putative pyoverdin transport system ATP-binding/permease protein
MQKIQGLGLALGAGGREEAGLDGVIPRSWSEIRLVAVQHHYESEAGEHGFELGPVDLSFDRGEVVYLTGGNGSGKTTFVKLLTGLYAPAAGYIHVDQTVIDDANRLAYRQLFSSVFSDFQLFDRPWGLDPARVAAVRDQYVARFGLAGKLDGDHERWNTLALSRGQRKRVALLVALMEDRPFYVFDEWAADQDPQFRRMFYTQVVPELRAAGKTVLVVSHDDRYFDLADRRIDLDLGRLSVCCEGHGRPGLADDSKNRKAVAI